jgi:hypothetical protein
MPTCIRKYDKITLKFVVSECLENHNSRLGRCKFCALLYADVLFTNIQTCNIFLIILKYFGYNLVILKNLNSLHNCFKYLYSFCCILKV